MFSTELGFHLFLKWQLGWEVNTKFEKFLLSFSPLDLYFKGYCKSANSANENLYIASGPRISAFHQNRYLRRKTIVHLLCYTISIPIISTQVQDVQINTEMIKNNIPGHERYPAWETSSVPGASGTDPQRWVVSAANALKIKIFNVSLYIVIIFRQRHTILAVAQHSIELTLEQAFCLINAEVAILALLHTQN